MATVRSILEGGGNPFWESTSGEYIQIFDSVNLEYMNLNLLEVPGGGPSGLLTSFYAPFGLSGRVTYALVIG